ncbi:DUF1302 family protein [Tepidicaulis sp.]|uniref:DUF1302 domain-containing protein n=1 Tax=Tepidicaulis sp. TaxID=1920809 RepID=UPI003B5C9822
MPASALEYQFGGVQIYFDTTVSAGVSARVSERNDLFLPGGNGGPIEDRGDVETTTGLTTTASAAAGNFGTQVVTLDRETGPNAFAGSINTDDGRLNFDKWDLTSGVVKMTNDIQANWQNYTLFARVNSFYDAVLDNDSSYERFALNEGGKVDAARDIDLLDLYVSADYNVGDLPLNLRIGRQVINWGEGTFILNGVNSVSPLDVNAFRRPGAEVKEGLLPVWAAYGSIGLPYNLALEGFYQLEWEETQLDRPGTPFSGSDVTAQGGVANAQSFVTGGRNISGFFNRNCSTPDAFSIAFDGALAADPRYVCGGTNAFVDYATPYPVGNNEALRLALKDGTGDIARDHDREASDSGQYGLALRWYSEELNSTEFGFYFMNYHSRVPIASQRLIGRNANTSLQVYTAVEQDSGQTSRQALLGGCTAGPEPGLAALTTNPAKVAYLNSVLANDPNNLLGAAKGVLGGLAQPNSGATISPTLNAALAAQGGIQTGSLLETMLVNCQIINNKLQVVNVDGAPTPVLVDGTEILANTTTAGAASNVGLFLEYPEDIKLFGFSFNTTIGDWGVQGETSFRPNQPLQLDTDQLTLATLGGSCLFDFILGVDLMSAQLDGSQTFSSGATCGQTPEGSVTEYTGFVREEVLTAQIGTTATYTQSNPLIGALGADLGILVTEAGAMWVPDVPDEADFSRKQLANVCTSGTDLPLGAFLALNNRQGCRPTSLSWGYVLLGQLQYNNAFGTPITLNPTIAWQHDVAGNAPAPLANYREGRKRVSLSLNGSYQSSWRGGISYTNFFGNEKYSKDGDRDFVSVNVSYSF